MVHRFESCCFLHFVFLNCMEMHSWVSTAFMMTQAALPSLWSKFANQDQILHSLFGKQQRKMDTEATQHAGHSPGRSVVERSCGYTAPTNYAGALITAMWITGVNMSIPVAGSHDMNKAWRVLCGGLSSVGRALDCDSSCHGFEPRRPPQSTYSIH